ncbi:MAG: hypothetical protein LBF16_09690 [Pseudomonadales bacterium]|jgi:hypothetical protein|nr:hypothetical protein [Pseudomonadales bacterium]
MMEFFQWIEDSGLGVYIRESNWGFAIALSAHAVGMGTAVGVVMVATLCELNVLPKIPVASFSNLYSVAWSGFFINLISGIALYTSHATQYSYQAVFIFKLALIVVGGVLLKLMIDSAKTNGEEAGKTKLFALLSLLSWVGAIVTGRLMAYFFQI